MTNLVFIYSEKRKKGKEQQDGGGKSPENQYRSSGDMAPDQSLSTG